MALRGKTPSKTEKRFKAFLYGKAGVGKTFASIQFPAPYLIDCEKGAENDQYVDMIKKGNGAVFNTSNFEEILKEVKALATEKHHYKTLIIDPITIVYDNLLIEMEEEKGSGFGKHLGAANKKMKYLISWLLKVDMNVILTAYSKNEYLPNMATIGQTFSGYKDLPYLFDLCLEVKAIGKERKALVVKSRIESFVQFEEIPFSYKEISKRYNNGTLDKDTLNIELATKDQLLELNNYFKMFNISEENKSKCLKIIEKLKEKMTPPTIEGQ
jgi:hypothetical protein